MYASQMEADTYFRLSITAAYSKQTYGSYAARLAEQKAKESDMICMLSNSQVAIRVLRTQMHNSKPIGKYKDRLSDLAQRFEIDFIWALLKSSLEDMPNVLA